MNADLNKSINQLKEIIQEYREKWRVVREERLKRKQELEIKGYSKNKIRRDSIYKQLTKEQKNLSKLIRHNEKNVNRKSSLIKISE